MLVKFILNRERCVGAGVCVSMCPEYFSMGEDSKSILKDSKESSENRNQELEIEVNEEKLSCLKEASAGCPVQAIEVKE